MVTKVGPKLDHDLNVHKSYLDYISPSIFQIQVVFVFDSKGAPPMP